MPDVPTGDMILMNLAIVRQMVVATMEGQGGGLAGEASLCVALSVVGCVGCAPGCAMLRNAA